MLSHFIPGAQRHLNIVARLVLRWCTYPESEMLIMNIILSFKNSTSFVKAYNVIKIISIIIFLQGRNKQTRKQRGEENVLSNTMGVQSAKPRLYETWTSQDNLTSSTKFPREKGKGREKSYRLIDIRAVLTNQCVTLFGSWFKI